MKRALSLIIAIMAICSWLSVFASAKTQDDPWSVHGQDYYGRTALSKLPNADALLFAYDQIAAGVEEASERISIYSGSKYISLSELEIVMDAYRRDYVQHFWLGNGYSYSFYDESRIVSVIPQYLLTGDALLSARAKYDAAVNEILSGITSSMSEFEKELYIHDRLAERITYTSGTINAHNSYGAIVEGKCVCEGYAEAFQYLLEREGIHSFIVTGDGLSGGSWGGHAWNYVRIDGKYYHVDLTWDDGSDGGYHEYFNVTDSIIQIDHRIDATAYDLPVCDALDANYHVVNGTWCDTYSVDMLVHAFISNNLNAVVYIPGDISTFLSWANSNIVTIASRCGVTGGFSYSYSWLNREYKLKIIPSNATGMAAVVETSNSKTWYGTVSEAVENSEDGFVKLLADCSEDITINKDLYIDLNGFDMTGKLVVTDGAMLFGMDSSTNDYDCTDDYGTISDLTGAYALHHRADCSGVAMRYLSVKKEGKISFHRFFAGIVYMSLQPSEKGVGYKLVFAGDNMVVDQLDPNEAFGFSLTLDGNATVTGYKVRDAFLSGKKVTLRINDFDVENHGETELYASALLKLKDGTVIESNQASMTLRGMLEKLNANVGVMNAEQLKALKEFLQLHSVIKEWNTDNLYK